MKKLFHSFLNFFKYEYLEFFSFVLLIFWVISPVVEYIFKFYVRSFYSYYFVFAIYFVGGLSFLEYIIYILKRICDKSFKIKECIPHIFLFILVILAIISSIFARDTHLSFFGDAYRKEGFFVYLMYIGFILSASIIKNKKYVKRIFKVIIFSSLFVAIMSIISGHFLEIQFSNVFRNFNHYGYFLMISIMLSCFMFVSTIGIKKVFYLIAYIFLMYMIILNDTFGCYLAIFCSLVFAVIYSLVKKYKRVDIILLFVVFIVSSFLFSHFDQLVHTKGTVFHNISSFSDDIKSIVSHDDEKKVNHAGSGRGRLWKEAWNCTLEHPVTGVGMENLKFYYWSKNLYYNDRPHNVILQISSFIGIPGAIIYIIFILYLAIGNLKNIGKNSVNFMIYVTAMCYFISSFFGNSMYYTSPYFMILLGFLISMNREKT